MAFENNKQNQKKEIPIFFAVDDNYSLFLAVALQSLKANSSRDYRYTVYVLHDGLKKSTVNSIKAYADEDYTIEFVNVRLRHIVMQNKLHTRDYYSKSTYYRLFIQSLFPDIDKALYLDSDIIVKGDISELYNVDLKDSLVGAAKEDVMQNVSVFGEYVEQSLGISRNLFFNAGVLVMNLKAFRKENVEKKFFRLLRRYKFSVTQDEDYLNVICKDRITYLSKAWNLSPAVDADENGIKLIHYKMDLKPWHYDGVRYGEYFWEYAKTTEFYGALQFMKENYSEQDKERDKQSYVNLVELAKRDAKREDSYFNTAVKRLNKNGNGKNNAEDAARSSRAVILQKIKELESQGIFDVDVEDDPETIPLSPDKVDYLGEKLCSRIMNKIANRAAVNYYEKLIKNGDFVIKEINGLENYRSVDGGAVITCNHFSALDNYAVYRAIRGDFKKGQNLYKVIREGNFTNFKGLYGFFFRHCNTLPLSSNVHTMRKFLNAVDVLLARGEKILIYPEQAMWWNYRKPRPLKSGAFRFAVKSKVPVIPCFITMQDTEKQDGEGYPVQAYTLWFMPPIYPKTELTDKENMEYLKDENFRLWKETYERVYGEPLKYGD